MLNPLLPRGYTGTGAGERQVPPWFFSVPGVIVREWGSPGTPMHQGKT